MSQPITFAIQKMFNLLGLQVRRVNSNVSMEDPYSEIARMAGEKVSTIFEVGAADGRDAAVFADKYPNARVHAFEPLPDNYAKLAEAAALRSNLVAVNAAVADQPGKAPFFVTSLDDASSLMKPVTTGSTFDKYMEAKSEISVNVMTLDDYAEKSGISSIDILKIDAQGAELKIFQGANELLSRGAVSVIYTEVQFLQLYEGAALFHEIADFLYSKNYHLHNLYGLVHNQNGRLSWGDAIFIRA